MLKNKHFRSHTVCQSFKNWTFDYKMKSLNLLFTHGNFQHPILVQKLHICNCKSELQFIFNNLNLSGFWFYPLLLMWLKSSTFFTQYFITPFFAGPAKANRLFGLVPVSHEDALVFAHSNNLDITFRMTRALTDFMATLHKNGTGK